MTEKNSSGSENSVKESWECVVGCREADHTHRAPGLRGASVRPVCMRFTAVCVQVYPHHSYRTISHAICWQGFKSFFLCPSTTQTFQRDLFLKSSETSWCFYFFLSHLTHLCLAWWVVCLESVCVWRTHTVRYTIVIQGLTGWRGILCHTSCQGGLDCKSEYVAMQFYHDSCSISLQQYSHEAWRRTAQKMNQRGGRWTKIHKEANWGTGETWGWSHKTQLRELSIITTASQNTPGK